MARRSVLKGLNDARAELARWPLPNAATRDVADDLKVGFRVARKALGEAREEPTTENLHELRKRVKRLGYNAQLLGKAWAELTPLARRDLDDLADRLGQEHDLGLLDAFVAREPETWPPDCDIATLRSAIAQRRAELVTESFGLARQTLKRKLRPRRSRRVLKRLFPVKLPLAVVPDDRQRQHS